MQAVKLHLVFHTGQSSGGKSVDSTALATETVLPSMAGG